MSEPLYVELPIKRVLIYPGSNAQDSVLIETALPPTMKNSTSPTIVFATDANCAEVYIRTVLKVPQEFVFIIREVGVNPNV